MRYYKVVISPPQGVSNGFNPVVYTSLTPLGGNNGSALQIELDVFQTYYHQPAQAGYIKLSGVTFQDLNTSANFNPSGNNYCGVQIFVGMSKGLPYANPQQAGMIINGSILQAFGNWQGNQTSLDLIVIPTTYVIPNDVNLSFNWQKGQTLQQAVTNTLNKAYPGVPVSGSFSSDLIYTETQAQLPMTLIPFSKYVNQVSKQIITNSDYQGASIANTPDGFYLTDGTNTEVSVIDIDFVDLIGNVTWINSFTIQFKVTMRADLNIGNLITLPRGIPYVNTAGSFSQARSNISFDGTYLINSIRHVGNNRQPDGNSWCTIIEAIIQGKPIQ